jgi:dCTP deaminase
MRVYLDKNVLIPVAGQTVSLTTPTDLKYDLVDLEKNKGYVLEPGGFILASTYEKFCTARDLLIFLDGRSTVARLGLTTHVTASVIDGKYEIPKSIVLEMKNLGNFNIHLNYKDPIGNVYFQELTTSVEQEIEDRYKEQQGVRGPNLYHKPNGRH